MPKRQSSKRRRTAAKGRACGVREADAVGAQEQTQTLLTEVLQILNRAEGLEPVISESLRAIQRATGFDAVGLRLRKGDDYPYFQQSGFTDEFLQQENFLCALDGAGTVVRDAVGRVRLECTCGLVVSGRTEPGMPCFTASGSFWTNRSQDLLALPREDDPRANPRNHCIHAGYQSVGLFPVRCGPEIVGLLQLNDRREGRFTTERVQFYESLAQNIGLALQRVSAEAALRRSERRYRSFIEVTSQFAWVTDAAGQVVEDIPALRAFTGQSYVQARGAGWADALHPDDVQRTLEVWNRAVATRTPYETEYRMRRHDGAYRVLLARGVPILDDNGSVTEWVGTCIDITERKAAEQALRQAHDELEARVGERTAELAKAHAAVDAERRRFKDVLDQLPAYLVLLTPDYQVPFANRFFEERFGKADGRRCYEYLFNRTTPCEACETFTVLETHQPHHWEWTGPDGRHYDIHDFPFTDVDGSPLIMEVGLDITERKRAEAALRELNETLELRVAERTAALHESEEKFRSAFANATIGMAMTTPAGHFVAANSAYCALTGYGLDELREMKFAQLIHPDDLAENEGLNERMMAGESADFVVENRYLRKDGRLVWVRKSVSLVRAPQGAPQWIIALVEDITARKEAEAELEWLASFPVRNPNPIFEVDLNGRVTYVNPAGEKSFPDLTQRGTEHPALADWPDLVRGCDASRGGYLGHREVRAGDCWYSQTLSYLADAQRLRVYNLDITARKQAEEALRLSRQDLDRAQAVGQIGWWRLDTRRNVLTWSDENYRIFGLPAATPLTYETFMATVHPDDRAYVDAQWRAGLRGAPYDLEHRIVADGRVKWVREKAYLEFDAAGQLLGGFGITQDITARKALELERDQLLEAERAARSEAERASRLKDEFLATLSHELRTPLGAVLGWAQMLQRGRLSTEEAQEAVATIEKNARLQKQLIDDLLDMGRVVSGKLKLELQPVEIAVVARDAVAMFRPEAEQKGVELRAMIRVASGQVLGDQGRLKQMIGNLLSNAIKFTSRGGDVRVIVAPRRGERVLIAVKDTGIGIAPDFLPHLFERFRQADASITRKYRGLGLGLAIVKQLVELHGGGVRAKSKGEGHGATFTIELPLLSNWSVKTEEAGPFAQPPGEVDLTGIRALVVDDEPATLALVGRILKECGVQTLCCASAGEAFEALVRAEFNVLVSDISMPGEDGYSLIRRIRALEDGRRSAIPAIALTAFIRPEDRRRAFEAGFEAHMTKPVDAAELCALVGRLARRFGVH